MGIQIQQVLAEVGWTDGFHVPVANEDNRKLELELEEKLKRKNLITTQIAEAKERLEAIQKHTKNVQTEHEQNQTLLTAHRAELDSERHMARIAETDCSRLQQEIKDKEKLAKEIMDRCESLKKDIESHTIKLEKLKGSVKIDRQALTEWEEELARGEEGTGLMERFTKEDEKEAHDLEVERVRLRTELEERRRCLEAITMDVTAAELAVDRTSKLFRDLHHERRILVGQWENSVKELRTRDTDIRRLLDEIATLRTQKAKREEEFAEQKRFYENEVENAQELETRMLNVRRQSSLIGDSNETLNKRVEELQHEMGVRQRDLAALGRRLHEQRAQNNRKQKDGRANDMRVMAAGIAVEALEARVGSIKDESATAQERVQQIEEMIQAEERYLKSVSGDIERANAIKLKSETKLLELKKQEEIQEMEMQALHTTRNNLKPQMANIERELSRQQEVLYNLEFEAQRLEGRIANVLGQREVPNREELEQKIEETEEQLKEKNEVFSLLTGQVKQLEDTMRRVQASMGIDTAELLRLEDRLKEGLLMADGGEKQLETTKKQYREKQVEESVVRLRVRQAEEGLQKLGDTLYTLDKQRLECESLMKERQVEIVLHRDMMLTKKRCLAEELSRLNMEVAQRRMRTAQLRNKFELADTAGGHDESGEYADLATVRTQIIQEKFILQHKGDELDEEIKKAEKEIQALENTLKVIHAANDTFKKNLSAVDEESPECQEKRDLEEIMGDLVDHMRRLRAQIKVEEVEIQKMETVLASALEDESEAQAELEEKERELAELEKELAEQQVKIDRAHKQVSQLTRELRGKRKTKEVSHEERDMDLRELTEQNRTALNILADASVRYPEAGPVIRRFLDERNIDLPMDGVTLFAPSRLTTRGSSDSRRSSSPTSSVSSGRSGRSVRSTRSSTESGSRASMKAPSVVTLEMPGGYRSSGPRATATTAHALRLGGGGGRKGVEGGGGAIGLKVKVGEKRGGEKSLAAAAATVAPSAGGKGGERGRPPRAAAVALPLGKARFGSEEKEDGK